MHLIKQKYSTSCGIACVAILAEKSHNTVIQTAIELFGWNSDSEFLEENSRTNSRDLIRLLAKFGLTAKLKKFEFRDALEGRNIVAVRFYKETNRWHWIVAERKGTELVIYAPEVEYPLILSKGEAPDGITYGRVKYHYLQIV